MSEVFKPDPRKKDINVKIDAATEQLMRDLAAASEVSFSVVVRRAIAIGVDALTK